MWENSTDEILEKLVGHSPQGLTFLGTRAHIGSLMGKQSPCSIQTVSLQTDLHAKFQDMISGRIAGKRRTFAGEEKVRVGGIITARL